MTANSYAASSPLLDGNRAMRERLGGLINQRIGTAATEFKELCEIGDFDVIRLKVLIGRLDLRNEHANQARFADSTHFVARFDERVRLPDGEGLGLKIDGDRFIHATIKLRIRIQFTENYEKSNVVLIASLMSPKIARVLSTPFFS